MSHNSINGGGGKKYAIKDDFTNFFLDSSLSALSWQQLVDGLKYAFNFNAPILRINWENQNMSTNTYWEKATSIWIEPPDKYKKDLGVFSSEDDLYYNYTSIDGPICYFKKGSGRGEAYFSPASSDLNGTYWEIPYLDYVKNNNKNMKYMLYVSFRNATDAQNFYTKTSGIYDYGGLYNKGYYTPWSGYYMPGHLIISKPFLWHLETIKENGKYVYTILANG